MWSIHQIDSSPSADNLPGEPGEATHLHYVEAFQYPSGAVRLEFAFTQFLGRSRLRPVLWEA